MKRILSALMTFAFCSVAVQAKGASPPADFSGHWVLNFDQTKDLPAGLQGYSMTVNQDEQQLRVKTTLEGNLQATPNMPISDYPGGTAGGGYPGRRGGMGGMGGVGSMGIPGAGTGMPTGGGGGRGGRPGAQGPLYRGVTVYKFYPPSAAYRFDGSQSSVQLGDPEQTSVTSKVEKKGTVLKLSLVGKEESEEGGGKIQIKEQWRLSEGGKTLEVDRSIKSPLGSETAHLVFSKREADQTPGGGKN